MSPELPVINVGTRDKPVYLPVEVCEVEAGQPVKNKLSPKQTQNMLNFAVKGRMPAQNAQSIVTKGVGVLGIGHPLNATLVSNDCPHFLTSSFQLAVSRDLQSSADNPRLVSLSSLLSASTWAIIL